MNYQGRASTLSTLIADLQQSLGILHKQDIQTAARYLPPSLSSSIPIGDDCAAIPDQNGYLLLAAEGILPSFLEMEPWFAGWCAVMVNISDIAAMGGRAIAMVDTIWSQSTEVTYPIWDGITAAASAYNIPIVGGHTNCHSPYNALSVAILGRASHLITSFSARPGDVLLVAIDFDGKLHPGFPFWNAATTADPVQLRQKLEILPFLSESGLCDAGKDISMGGIIGTLLMLLETSSCGAMLDIDAIPRPDQVPLAEWLLSFPSYGFLLSIRPENVAAVQACFAQHDLVCATVGSVESHRQLVLNYGSESAVFWDLSQRSLTGFSSR
jgi:uncharacterized protein